MKKLFKNILNYVQIAVGIFIFIYLKGKGLDTNNINDLGLILAVPSTYCIIVGFLNRFSDDWAGFTVVAIMIYSLIIMLKMKFFMIGIPAMLGLVCVFYFPSGMNLDRIKANKEKKENNKSN